MTLLVERLVVAIMLKERGGITCTLTKTGSYIMITFAI